MARTVSIITVGLSPAWDITCRGQSLDWGRHEYIDEQTIRPAGKALNVCKALAWMGQASIAAGLWGRDDYEQMLKFMRASSGRVKIKIKMTAVAGSTRRNVTVVDTASGKDIHLRHRSHLASPKALRKLTRDLETLVHKDSLCVFAGTMPEGERLGDVIRVIEFCKSRGAKIVLDTSGPALRGIVHAGAVWLIKPNVEELCELLDEPPSAKAYGGGRKIKDGPVSLARAGRRLLDRAEIVLISRGRKGSVVVTKEGAWQARCLGRARVSSTVGCGDYLLGGFLKGLKDKPDAAGALQTATRVATAKAWGWMESNAWPQVKRKITVEINRV
jgi:1-phosphofructokinase